MFSLNNTTGVRRRNDGRSPGMHSGGTPGKRIRPFDKREINARPLLSPIPVAYRSPMVSRDG